MGPSSRMISSTALFLLSGHIVLGFAYGYDGDEKDPVTNCPKAFLGRCTCGKQTYSKWRPDEQVYLVNCTNTGFSDTSMLEMLPNGTQVLIFNGNNVPFLDWNLLGSWDDHKYLEVVDLSNNNITEITGKSFHKVSYVKRLVLNHNNIKISGQYHHRRLFTNFERLEELLLTNAFTEVVDSKWYLDDLRDIWLASNMTYLYKLHLEQNEIWSISKDLFCDLPRLSDLYLGDNQLKDIEFNFECIKNLRFLDLQYNKIKRLDQVTLDRIDSVFAGNSGRKINLGQNPWVCDCYLRKFFEWVVTTRTSIHRRDELRCYKGTPEVNAGRKFTNLRLLMCPSQQNSSTAATANQHSVTNTLLTILILLLVVLLLVLLYVYRVKVGSAVKPLVDNFQRSMQYRTIERSVNESNGDNVPVVFQTSKSGPSVVYSSLSSGSTLPPQVNV